MNNDNPADFQQVQTTFTQHMRDPVNNPAPDDVEDRRMAIYRRLLFGNVSGFMEKSFPVTRSVLDNDTWNHLIRDYFSQHQAHTPLFPKMPQEFVKYLQQERDNPNDYPFLSELAHYEWTGMSIKFDGREIDFANINREGDYTKAIPAMNPLITLMSYQFPVQNIDPDHIPETIPEQPTFVAVYRNEHDEVGYIELNPVSARLLDLAMHNQQKTGLELIQQIVDELQHPNPDVVIQGGLQILNELYDKGIILGTQR